ncbi:MAG: zf-HC2 domain-containing protein [bacterium]
MGDKHVISLFQVWEEDRLDAEERRVVQRHLKNCKPCREYFEKMSMLLDSTDPSLLPRLEPDPFLPARIRALYGANDGAKTGAGLPRVGALPPWLRAAFAGLMTAVAVAAGVYLGRGLATPRSTNGDTAIVTAYYEAVAQTGFAGSWGDVIEENAEDQQ